MLSHWLSTAKYANVNFHCVFYSDIVNYNRCNSMNDEKLNFNIKFIFYNLEIVKL